MYEFLKGLLKGIFSDFFSWMYFCAEEITGLSIGFIAVTRVDVQNEFLHSTFSIITMVIGAYLVFKLKQEKFKISWSTIRKIFKNSRK